MVSCQPTPKTPIILSIIAGDQWRMMGSCGTLPILSLSDITEPGTNSLILLVLFGNHLFVPKTLEESGCRLQDRQHCSLGCYVFMERSRDKFEPNHRAFALLLILLLWHSTVFFFFKLT